MRRDDTGRRLRLTLIGGFALVRGSDEEVVLPRSAQRLLAFLALHLHPVVRSYVAGSLWPDASEAHSAACLRSSLWRLRRCGPPIVAATASHLRLTDELGVDTREIHETVHQLSEAARGCGTADPLQLTGELLPHWDDEDWVLFERERLRQVCLHGLEAMCEQLMALGRHGAAIEAALVAIRTEPLRESAHRLLISIHLAEGNRSEALRQYRWYHRLLRSELGIEPSRRITELVDQLEQPVGGASRGA